MKKIILPLGLLAAASAHAAEHEVKMLDIGSDKEPMVFEPAVLKIAPGDTVTFKVKLLAPIAMNNNDRFAIREGGRTVGSGVITSIIK